jgi:signal transduction histidine kinase/FixJ family two-component response regulator
MPKQKVLRGFQPIGVVALCALMVATIWVVLIYDLRRLQQNAMVDAQNATQNLSKTFRENVGTTLAAIDQMMIAVIEENNEAGRGLYLPAWIGSSPLLKRFGIQSTIIGPNGMSVASTVVPAPVGLDLSDRPHFRHHLDPQASQPYISVPMVGRASGKWSIQITRRIVSPDGSFGGVMVVSLDPFYFSQFFDDIDIGKDGLASLAGYDGIVRSRRTLAEGAIGQDISKGELFKQALRSSTGSIISRSVVDNVERVFSYAAVPGYPLFVNVGFATSDVFAEIDAQKNMYLIIGGGLSIIFCALGWFIARETKRKRMRDLTFLTEERTREQKLQLDAALNNMRDGLLMFDSDNRAVVFNRRLIEMYKLPSEKVTPGSSLREILEGQATVGMFAEDIDAYIEELATQEYTGDKIVDLPDGRSFRIVSRTMASGGWVSTHEDVTERRNVEKQLLELNTELEERVNARTAELTKAQDHVQTARVHAEKMEAIGKITGGMAHDFNNYLGIIIGNLDLVRNLPPDDPLVKDLIEEAMSGALSSSELTKSLLAFSRRQPLAARQIDVGEAVAADAALLKRTLRSNVTLTTQVASGLWPVNIDRAQLDSCIVNLIKNANDAIPVSCDGAVVMSACNVHLDEQVAASNEKIVGGDYVLIAISDNGTGMSPEIAAQVFEPFFTTKPAGHGTGLGLSMVYGFVKQSGGYVKLDSEVGRGTTVQIYLPRDATSERGSEINSGPPVAMRGRAEAILVVDDNDRLRRTVVTQLGTLGYQVIEADSGITALAILEQSVRHIDLLLTDIIMPGNIDGYQLAERAFDRRPGIRVLLTSGFPGDPSRRSERTAALTLLSKPCRIDDLARAIRMELDARPETQRPSEATYDLWLEADEASTAPTGH